jgi:hypothetical protein
MHPLVKIILLLAACQVLQTIYLMHHSHRLHGVSLVMYWLKFAPLIIMLLALFADILEMLGVAIW